MKWSIVALVFAGIVAALGAAVLAWAWRAGSARAESPLGAPADVTIVQAATGLSAMAVVDARSVVTRTLPAKDAPRGALSSPAQVIGKVLVVPMVEGQVFTDKCFPSEGSRAVLAAVLPTGFRAVSVVLDQHSGLEGLLYPGCVVDVLASYKVPTANAAAFPGGGEPVTRTLMQGVQVLAVEDQTVVSPARTADASAVRGSSPGNRLVASLLVTSRDAEKLQLAMLNGSISLAMRNPLDKAPIGDEDGVRLSQLAKEYAAAPAPTVAPPKEVTDTPPAATAIPVSQWETTVYRGGAVERQSFPLPHEGR